MLVRSEDSHRSTPVAVGWRVRTLFMTELVHASSLAPSRLRNSIMTRFLHALCALGFVQVINCLLALLLPSLGKTKRGGGVLQMYYYYYWTDEPKKKKKKKETPDDNCTGLLRYEIKEKGGGEEERRRLSVNNNMSVAHPCGKFVAHDARR